MRPEEVYAAVYLPEFPAQTLARLRTELRGRAVAVTEGERPFERVCSADVRARQRGIELGMTRAEAEMCGVVLLRRSAGEEAAAQGVALECLASLGPRMEVTGGGTSYGCVLDLSGTERLLGRAAAVARQAVSRLDLMGLRARIAVARNFHTAVFLARSSRERVVVVEAGEEARWLAPLPLTALEMAAEIRETFAGWGLRTVGDLTSLPEVELIARIGQEGQRLRQMATGTCPHLFRPVEEGFRLEEYVEFDGPVEVLESLLFAVNPMLEQLMTRAASRAMAVAAVTLICTLEGAGEHVRRVRPALPTTDRQALLKLLHLDLEAHAPNAGVVAVRLAVEPGLGSTVQMGLFSPQLPEPMRLEVTLARVEAIVGEGRVGKPVLRDTHGADGCSVEAFVTDGEVAEDQPVWRSSAALRRVRPAALLTVDVAQGSLRALWHERVRYDVSRLYGPWQSSGAWWSGEVWSGESWDFAARAGDGALLLGVVRHDLLRGVWLLDGLYD